MAQSKLTLGLSLLLALGFVFFGVQKFGAENIVFETLAERSGIDLFEPVVRYLTGIAELLTAVLLVLKRTRFTGAVLGLMVLLGAIVLHLSPWLGINVPEIGYFLFIVACIMTVLSVINIRLLRKAGGTLILLEKPATTA